MTPSDHATANAATVRARQEVLAVLRGVLVDRLQLARRPDELDPAAPLFGAGFGLDSLDAVELVVALESQLGVRVSDGDVMRGAFRSLDTVVDLVLAHRAGAGTGTTAADAPPPEPPPPADPIAAQVLAIRRSVALTTDLRPAVIRLRGDGALALAARVSPRGLTVRSGQMLHTLLLDADARPLADLHVCVDEDDVIVLADGPSGPALRELVAGHASGLDVELVDLGADAGFLALDGPYAWELLAEIAGPDVIGLPYLGFFHHERFTCFRAGKTGEYGYLLLVPRAEAAALEAELVAHGARFDLARGSRAAIERAALEVGNWDVRRQSPEGITPVELQLQWRVDREPDHPAAAALAARRAAPARRTVLVAADRPLAAGAAVSLDGRRVGALLDAGAAPTVGGWLGLALVDVDLAHPGVIGLVAGASPDDAGGPVPLRPRSSPAVDNRSLYVDAQRHTYAGRGGDAFPPLVRPAGAR